MITVVIENDQKLEERFKEYVNVLAGGFENARLVYNANHQTVGTFIQTLTGAEAIAVYPTQIGEGQYNGILMLLLSMIRAKNNSIKEIHLFETPLWTRSEFVKVFKKNKEYLDEVLKHIKVYNITRNEEYEKEEIIF